MENKVFPKNRSSKLASIFARFWCQHASIFGPNIHQNPSKNRFQDASLFRSIFASIFRRTKTTKVGPRRRPKRQDGPKKLPKTAPRGSQKTGSPRSCWVLAAKRPQEASKTAQEAPKRPPRRPKMAQDAPKTAQDGPRWPPKWNQNRRKSLLKYSIVLAGPLKSSKVPLELIFGRILMDF